MGDVIYGLSPIGNNSRKNSNNNNKKQKVNTKGAPSKPLNTKMTNKNEEKVVEDSIESVMEEQLKKNLKEVTAWIEEEKNILYNNVYWMKELVESWNYYNK